LSANVFRSLQMAKFQAPAGKKRCPRYETRIIALRLMRTAVTAPADNKNVIREGDTVSPQHH